MVDAVDLRSIVYAGAEDLITRATAEITTKVDAIINLIKHIQDNFPQLKSVPELADLNLPALLDQKLRELETLKPERRGNEILIPTSTAVSEILRELTDAVEKTGQWTGNVPSALASVTLALMNTLPNGRADTSFLSRLLKSLS